MVEIVGKGGRPGDAVTVDGLVADVLSFDVDGDEFVARIWIEEEGAHAVCVLDTDGRVYTRAPDAETLAAIDALSS